MNHFNLRRVEGKLDLVSGCTSASSISQPPQGSVGGWVGGWGRVWVGGREGRDDGMTQRLMSVTSSISLSHISSRDAVDL